MIDTNYQAVGPAYGRDYTTGNAAKHDFLAGKDFEQHFYPATGGKYCSISDFKSGVIVEVRYSKMNKFVMVTVP